MRKDSRNCNRVYPEEKEGRAKDANNKLRAQIKNLKKRILQLETHNKTIERAYSKSCDFIQDKLSDKSLEQVLNMVNNYEHKETQRGREKAEKEDSFNVDKCPDCDSINGKGFSILNFEKYKIESCNCGYRRKVE